MNKEEGGRLLQAEERAYAKTERAFEEMNEIYITVRVRAEECRNKLEPNHNGS